MGCRVRIWDNGDMTDCGDPVVHKIEALCEKHLQEAIEIEFETIQMAESKILKARARLYFLYVFRT